MPADPATVPSGPWRLLGQVLRRHRGRLIAGSLLISVWQVCEAMVPVAIGLVIDNAVATGSWSALAWSIAGLCALFAVLSTGYRLGARITFAAVQRESHRVRLGVVGHLLRPQGARTSLLPGQTLSLATSDADQVAAVMRFAGFALAAVAGIGVSSWLLLTIEVQLGLAVLIGTPLVVVLVQVATPLIARRSGARMAAVAETVGVATDLVEGIRVLRGIGAEDEAARRYRVTSRRAEQAGVHASVAYGVQGLLTTALSALLLAGVALLAGRLALRGEISIGELIAVVGLAQFLAEPVTLVGMLSAQAAAAAGSARRLIDFWQSPAVARTGTRAPHTPAEVELRDVVAGPLVGIDLRSRPGELLAVVVPDPSQAVALRDVLAGERPVERGEVRLGAVPLEDLDPDARVAALMVDPSHPELFEGTLRDNVDPAGDHADAELTAILAASAADDVVDLRPGGTDQRVAARGATYSGGQRQRVALARALAADPEVLVLHDPTTAVDSVTEQRIAAGLRALRHPDEPDRVRTTWVLTSSPALLDVADRVVLVEDGRVVAEGTHHDLTADPEHGARYRRAVLR